MSHKHQLLLCLAKKTSVTTTKGFSFCKNIFFRTRFWQKSVTQDAARDIQASSLISVTKEAVVVVSSSLKNANVLKNTGNGPRFFSYWAVVVQNLNLLNIPYSCWKLRSFKLISCYKSKKHDISTYSDFKCSWKLSASLTRIGPACWDFSRPIIVLTWKS